MVNGEADGRAHATGRHAVTVLLVAAGTVSCMDGQRRAATFTAVDSAGVEIVTSTAPAWGETEGWDVATQPEVSIGSLDGEQPYLLDQVAGATRMPDGRIVLLNAGDGQLRFYDPDGEFITARAGLGQGPGELERPGGLSRLGSDTLLVSEIVGWKVSAFDGDGEYLGSRRLDNVRMNAKVDSFWGCPRRPDASADGTYLGCAGSGRPREQVEGIERVSHWLFRTDFDVDEVDTVGVVDGFSLDVLLGAMGSAVTTGGDPLEVYVGDPAFFEISVWIDGRGTVRSIRFPAGLRPISEDEKAEYRKRYPESAARRDAVFAEFYPAFQYLTRDGRGYLWATKYVPPWEKEGGAWVFSPDGVLLGSVALPRGFRPFEIGDDYILGVRTDKLGVEYAEVYSLRRDR